MPRKPAIQQRKHPRQERARATVDAILTAAARVLVKEGFERANTNRIAQVAGVSIGTLYQYFPNKESLAAALMERHVRGSLDLLPPALASGAMPLREAIRTTIQYVVDAHKLEPALHNVLTEQIGHLGVMDSVRQTERLVHGMMLRYLQAHSHELRPERLELAAFVCAQAIEGITHGAVVHHPEYLASSEAELVDEMVALIEGYLVR